MTDEKKPKTETRTHTEEVEHRGRGWGADLQALAVRRFTDAAKKDGVEVENVTVAQRTTKVGHGTKLTLTAKVKKG